MLIHDIINWLEAGAPHVGTLHGFDYGNWIKADPESECGTLACIAGAAIQFSADDFKYDAFRREYRHNGHLYLVFDVEQEARALLNLTESEAELLFYPFDIHNGDLEDTPYYDPDLPLSSFPLSWTRDLNPEQIAVVLKHFAETGDINWELALCKS